LLGNDCLKKTISSVSALDLHRNEQSFKPGVGTYATDAKHKTMRKAASWVIGKSERGDPNF
jgi:hypothetical protein